jgi:hypothetical protein
VRPPASARIACGAGLLIALFAGWYYLSTHDLAHTWREFQLGHPFHAPPARAAPRGAAAHDLERTVAAPLLRLGEGLTLSTFLATAVVGSSRAHSRSRRGRRNATWELQLGREDSAEPFEVQKLIDGLHGELHARWYERPWRGQDSIALETHKVADGTVRMTLVAQPETRAAVEGLLRAAYPDLRLVPVDGRPLRLQHVVRLKKARSYILSIQTLRDYQHSFTESLIATVGELPGVTTVQLVLTPVPRLVARRARGLLRARERAANKTDQLDPAAPGAGSVVVAKELKGALETAGGHSLCYFELRVASSDPDTAKRVAGLFAQLRSENELVRRNMRARRRLYLRRLRVAAPNPLPGNRTGILSSSEIATMWQLPSARLKHAPLMRAHVRRASAPPAISRDQADGLLRDELGPVGLLPDDRKYGWALVGGQGVGKSSAMAQAIANDARDCDKALIVLDPKEDLAKLVLGVVPASRVVHYLDLGAPECGINPLTVQGTPGAKASMFVRALVEANPPGAIQAASDSFLRQAISAVCHAVAEPTLWHVYRMLEPGESPFRERIVVALDSMDGTDFARGYWRREFPALIRSPGFAAAALNPPRNKIERLISTTQIDVLLRHPVPLDTDGIVKRGEVLIVNGAKAEVGEDNATLVMHVLLGLVQRALQRQQRAAADDRRKVALYVDEAHNVLTPSVARMLAEGRSAGLEPTFAWQYNAQIVDQVVRSGVRSLLQSVSLFRMREIEDARSMAGLAMQVYTDRIGLDPEEQSRLRFSVDDVLAQPSHHCINLWLAGGQPQAAFSAETSRYEELRSDELAEHHLRAQRERGGFCPPHLPDPTAGDEPPPGSRPTRRARGRSAIVRVRDEGAT